MLSPCTTHASCFSDIERCEFHTYIKIVIMLQTI
ncbi:hypothetical protein LINPERPRIM_LOCUS14030 [Linum perenne]